MNLPRGIDFEGNLDLRNTTRSGRNTVEFEFTEVVVVASHGTFSLVDLDENGRFYESGRVASV